MKNKIEINLEDFIGKMIERCRIISFLGEMSSDDVSVSYSKGVIKHIWLHCNVNNFDRLVSHRIAYEKRYGDKEYSLNHYIWFDGKGWSFVGTLKGKLIKNFKPKKL